MTLKMLISLSVSTTNVDFLNNSVCVGVCVGVCVSVCVVLQVISASGIECAF